VLFRSGRLEVSESAAVAVNGVVAPTAGAVPLTVTALTVALAVVEGVEGVDGVEAAAGDVGELESLHAAENETTATSSSSFAFMKSGGRMIIAEPSIPGPFAFAAHLPVC